MKKKKMFLGICLLMIFLLAAGCTEKKVEEREEVPIVNIGISERSGLSEDFEQVSERLGDMTEEKIGIRAELVWTGLNAQNSYYKNRQLDVDITNMYFAGYQTAKEKNQLLNLEPYLAEAPALRAALEEKADLASWNDEGVYGIPKPLSDTHGDGVILNREYVEKYGMDISVIHQPEDLEPLFEIIKEKEPDVIPWVLEKSGNAVLEREVIGDLLDDCLSCLTYDDDDYVVRNLYETKAYEKQVYRAKRWQEQGYLAKNVLTEVENGKNQVLAGEAFATECTIKPDENQYDESILGDQIIIRAFDSQPTLNTQDDWVLVWSVYEGTANPGEAVQVLNLLYEDEDVLNLLLYGIEGMHYEVLEDGTFQYPQGVTNDNVGYSNFSKWKYNTLEAGIWEGMSADLKGDMDALRNGLRISKAYGFWLDESRITVNLNNLRQIVEDYTLKLEVGLCDTEDYLVQFRQALREAGSNQLLREVQEQLDEWRTEKEQFRTDKE